MATWRGNQRQLLDAIGIEGETPFDVTDDVALVAPSFDTIKAYGAFGGTRLMTSVVPTAVAARNSAVLITANVEGCWINARNAGGNNFVWSTFRAGDGSIFANQLRIAGPAFHSEAVGSQTTFWGGSQTTPDPSSSLLVAITGDIIGAVGKAFMVGGVTLFGGPIWLPPFSQWQGCFVTQNVTGIIDLDIYVPDETRLPS